jgi:hypothetical protein
MVDVKIKKESIHAKLCHRVREICNDNLLHVQEVAGWGLINQFNVMDENRIIGIKNKIIAVIFNNPPKYSKVCECIIHYNNKNTGTIIISEIEKEHLAMHLAHALQNELNYTIPIIIKVIILKDIEDLNDIKYLDGYTII